MMQTSQCRELARDHLTPLPPAGGDQNCANVSHLPYTASSWWGFILTKAQDLQSSKTVVLALLMPHIHGVPGREAEECCFLEN